MNDRAPGLEMHNCGPGAECPISSSHPTVALVMGAVQTQREGDGQFYSRKAIKEGFLEEAVLERSLRS